jgi:hypothetical protein
MDRYVRAEEMNTDRAPSASHASETYGQIRPTAGIAGSSDRIDQLSADAEITEFDRRTRHENVRRLDITMNNLPARFDVVECF